MGAANSRNPQHLSSNLLGLDLKYGNRNFLEPSGPVQYCLGIGLEIWEQQPPGTLRACPVLFRDWASIMGAATSWNPQGLSSTV